MLVYTVDIILFLILDLIILQQALKMKSNYYNDIQLINVSSISHRTRICFILLCLIANLSRTISIVILDITSFSTNEYTLIFKEEANIQKWSQNILRTLPSLIYLSSYSVVVLFWAHVYYSSILTSTPYMITFFILSNTIVYSLYFLGIIISLFNNLLSFITFSLFLLTISYVIISISLLYFGLKVTAHLSRRAASGTILRYNVIQRVLFLTIFCPILLFTRGVISGIQCIYSFMNIPIYSRLLDKTPIGDTFVFILTELFPSIIVVVSFWQKLSPSTLNVSTRGLGFTSGVYSHIPQFNDNQFTHTSSVPLINNMGAMHNLNDLKIKNKDFEK